MIHEFFIHNFLAPSMWLLSTFGCVTLAMTVDLVCGIIKSRRMGVPLNSRGLKRTADKAVKYYLPMVCLACVDIPASVIMPFPALTMLYGVYCVLCEVKSIFETVEQKSNLRDIARQAQVLSEKYPELAEFIKRLIK